MRQEPDFFADRELTLIYIAKRLKEAQALEARFTSAGIDFLVEPDYYVGGFLFRAERVGAFFYVEPDQVGRAHAELLAHGCKPYQPAAIDSRKDEPPAA